MDEWISHDNDGELASELRSAPEPDRDRQILLLQLLEDHGAQEGALVESYREVVERSSAGEAVQYLVSLILEDEQRHHDLFARMANRIRTILWEVPFVPRLPVMESRSDPELLAETERLLAFEKRDAKELRALRKTLKNSEKQSLDPLMVELMLHDTAKHIAILEYTKAHLTR